MHETISGCPSTLTQGAGNSGHKLWRKRSSNLLECLVEHCICAARVDPGMDDDVSFARKQPVLLLVGHHPARSHNGDGDDRHLGLGGNAEGALQVTPV